MEDKTSWISQFYKPEKIVDLMWESLFAQSLKGGGATPISPFCSDQCSYGVDAAPTIVCLFPINDEQVRCYLSLVIRW